MCAYAQVKEKQESTHAQAVLALRAEGISLSVRAHRLVRTHRTQKMQACAHAQVGAYAQVPVFQKKNFKILRYQALVQSKSQPQNLQTFKIS